MSEDRDRESLLRWTEGDVASAREATGLVTRLEPDDEEDDRRELYGVQRARRPGRLFRRK